jgi:hypothetical protein
MTGHHSVRSLVVALFPEQPGPRETYAERKFSVDLGANHESLALGPCLLTGSPLSGDPVRMLKRPRGRTPRKIQPPGLDQL